MMAVVVALVVVENRGWWGSRGEVVGFWLRVLYRSYYTACGFLHNQIDSTHGDTNGYDEEVSDKVGRAQERKDTGVV
jgi:hypothetical protein